MTLSNLEARELVQILHRQAEHLDEVAAADIGPVAQARFSERAAFARRCAETIAAELDASIARGEL